MNSPSFRQLDMKDFKAVESILSWAFQWRSTAPVAEVPPELRYIIDDWGKRSGDAGIGAWDPEDGSFRGGIFWRFWKEDYHSYGFVDENVPELGIALDPSVRNGGLGALLLRSAQREILRAAFAGEVPRAAMSLSVEKENHSAAALYRKLGFDILEERDDDLLMLWQSGLRIEAMGVNDIDAALAVWKNSPGVWVNEDGEDSREELLAFLDRNPGLSFVARAASPDGGLITFPPDIPASEPVVAAVICGFDGRRGYVHHLAVLPAFRRRGLGRDLLEAIRGALARKGVRKMHLFVFDTNEPAKEFYRQLGWQYRDDIAMFSSPIDQGTAAER
jgi:ribosomal protein S18 acetylase RimI-like enzyme